MTPQTRPGGPSGPRDGDVDAVLSGRADAPVQQDVPPPDEPEGSTLEEVPEALEDDEEDRHDGPHVAGEGGRRSGAGT